MSENCCEMNCVYAVQYSSTFPTDQKWTIDKDTYQVFCV
jgi:hypothetical protein